MTATTELAGATALVTGGSRNIGRAIALALAAAGASVAIVTRRDREAGEAEKARESDPGERLAQERDRDAKRTCWSKKGDGPRYAQCARAVSGPQPPPLWTRRWMNAYILTLGRNFLTAWRNAVTGSRARGLQSRTGGNAEEPRPNVPLRESEGD